MTQRIEPKAPWRTLPPALSAYGLQAEQTLTEALGAPQNILAFSIAQYQGKGRTLLLWTTLVLIALISFILLLGVASETRSHAGLSRTLATATLVVVVICAGLAWICGVLYIVYRLIVEAQEARRLKLLARRLTMWLGFFVVAFPAMGFIGLMCIVGEFWGNNAVIVRGRDYLAILRLKPLLLYPRFLPPDVYPLDAIQVTTGKTSMMSFPVTISHPMKVQRLSVLRKIMGNDVMSGTFNANIKALLPNL